MNEMPVAFPMLPHPVTLGCSVCFWRFLLGGIVGRNMGFSSLQYQRIHQSINPSNSKTRPTPTPHVAMVESPSLAFNRCAISLLRNLTMVSQCTRIATPRIRWLASPRFGVPGTGGQGNFGKQEIKNSCAGDALAYSECIHLVCQPSPS